MKNKSAIIVGAGLTGTLLGTVLAKEGYRVRIYEKRDDLRKYELSAGKSINLSLSERGWKALRLIGASEEIRELSVPMYGRVIHTQDGEVKYQPYGRNKQAIYSLSRGGMTAKLLDIAEKNNAVEIIFNHECIDVDLKKGHATFRSSKTGEITSDQADVVFGADGAFSSVRYTSMQKESRFNFSQNYIEDGYKELLLPANSDGSYKLEKNALHVWPRKEFMLTGLPNQDGSFTCTLFMPFKGDKFSFNKLKTKDDVSAFIRDVFPDFYRIMPNVADEWFERSISALAYVKCFPWTIGQTALIGDAAHATVPFYGQGMNCGFEDVTTLWSLLKKHEGNIPLVFSEYENTRKPNADAMQDLSLQNYKVIRELISDENFLLRKKIEANFSEAYPEKWTPLYSQVSFSDIPYSEALELGDKQEAIMKSIMEIDGIKERWKENFIHESILSHLST